MAPLKSSFSRLALHVGLYSPPKMQRGEKTKPRCNRVALLRENATHFTVVISICYRAAFQFGPDCNAKCNAHLAALHTLEKKRLCNAKCNALERNH
jgi:hypothetical protein